MQERQHVFFDLDGTLTESRTKITARMTALLHALFKVADVGVISGAVHRQMLAQIPWLSECPIYVMPQSGNESYLNDRLIWRNELDEATLACIRTHIEEIRSSASYKRIVSAYVPDEKDIVEFRGGQVSFSMIGHNALLSRKTLFDPDASIRRALLKEFPFDSELAEVNIGGTTNFDYTRKGWNKAGNVTRLTTQLGWGLKRCMYIGDRLHEGGNDYVMVPVMACQSVGGPIDTACVIERILTHYGSYRPHRSVARKHDVPA
jgi:phosphomannomutase